MQNAHQITADDTLINTLLEQQFNENSMLRKSDVERAKAYNDNFEAAMRLINQVEQQAKNNSSKSKSNKSKSEESDENGSEWTRHGVKRKHASNEDNEEEDELEVQSKSKPKTAVTTAAHVPSSSDLANMAMSLASGVDSSSAYKMQPFMFESQDEAANIFPCMVYLPVGVKLNKPLSLKVTLKPVETQSEDEESNDQMQPVK